jgi:hypothetical protein
MGKSQKEGRGAFVKWYQVPFIPDPLAPSNDGHAYPGGPMKQTTLKRIAILTLFLFAGIGTLRADAPVTTMVPKSGDPLSWPMGALLDPSFNWVKSKGMAEKCLLVGRLDPKSPSTMNLLYPVDLPGERFVAALPGCGFWDFKETLTKAGYVLQVPIPDKQVILDGQEETLRDRYVTGYVKRAGNNIRIIVISHNDDCGARTASAGGPQAPSMKAVFVSNVTPIEQILKEQKR